MNATPQIDTDTEDGVIVVIINTPDQYRLLQAGWRFGNEFWNQLHHDAQQQGWV